jgi:thiamine monophosphate kinase
MGLALIAVATATYLLANASDTAAWAALGTAAVITVAMPAILVAFQSKLAETVDEVEVEAIA